MMGVMRKWHRVQTAEASAVHNDASAFGTDGESWVMEWNVRVG